MSDLPNDVIAQVSKAQPTPYIVLFTLKQTDQSPGFRPIIHNFTSTHYGTEPIVFGGITYQALPIVATGFELKTDGTQATPRISATLGTATEQGRRELENIIGWELTRTRTLETFLDNGATPNALGVLSSDVYRVERKVSQTADTVIWELHSGLDQEGVSLPRRQITRDHCKHTYPTWDEKAQAFNYEGITCPYRHLRKATTTRTEGGVSVSERGGEGGGGGGGAPPQQLDPTAPPPREKGYDENNRPVQDEANDVCGRTVRSCGVRFGRGVSLPLTQFPGVRRT